MQKPYFLTAHGKAFQHQCERMIDRLRLQGIRNEKVLDAMRIVPRHLFVDDALSSHAYSDHALPIGQGQTISQPYVVARMTETLVIHAGQRLDKVLEIGTGCGYQTAILACLFKRIYSVERLQSLSQRAQERLSEMRLGGNVFFHYGDGYQGWSEHGPYQSIIVTAAPEEIPSALLEQMEQNGCMVIPVGPQRSHQKMMKIVRHRQHYEHTVLEGVSFVPLRAGIQ